MPRQAGGRATVRDIAADAGVSIATVSRVLNDSDDVAPGTRDLVLAAIERLGGLAPVPRARRSRIAEGAVYVHCPYVLADYFGLIVSSIAETLDLHGRRLMLNAGEAVQGKSVLPGLPLMSGVAGAIMLLPPEPSEQLVTLRSAGFPFVVVDPRTALPRDIAAVSAAHFTGARRLTQHLVELGHRRIGVIGGPRNWLAADGRRAGHAAALSEVGVLASPELVRSAEPTADNGFRLANELLALPDRPTALLGFNDKMAVGAMAAVARLGLRVPEDISIAGFDDIDLSRATSPLLTTVRQPLEEMGRMAVTLLVRLLERHQLEALHVELATELIVRDSTGPVSA
ncbi:LacI family DNA-binding transcriptional regulator [Kutzneria sp. NPDC052558]|uniref:LacI family DNA-binding transcriptional regulator n=1 Tax=Kutzneria sp. NPDC052558 TaxID=3364121 RepID=UPI0037CCA3D4